MKEATQTKRYWGDIFLGIIAQETQLPKQELGDDENLTELGVDWVLSKSIIGQFNKISGLNLPSNFTDVHSSLGSIKAYFQELSTATDFVAVTDNKAQESKPQAQCKTVRHIPMLMRLQGNPALVTKNLFLFPDGGGSAYSYAHIPEISPNVCIYAFNSPLLNATSNTLTIEDLVPIWLGEIRRIQPSGPYTLGGWSAGGYHAYETAKQLINEGQMVEKMVLIDSPCRLVFEALPLEVVQYLFDRRLLGNWQGTTTPQWLLDHFDKTIKAVENYQPTALPAYAINQVCLIWAEDPVFKMDIPEDFKLDCSVEVTRFLLLERSDFGPNGWDKLIPQSRFSIATTMGNHFTLAFPPNAGRLGELLADAMLGTGEKQEGTWTHLHGMRVE